MCGLIIRDGDLEGIVSMAVFPVQWPSDLLVQLLKGSLSGFGDMAHDGVNRLALVVPLLALDDIFGRNSTLGKIDVTCTETEPIRRMLSSTFRVGHTCPFPYQHEAR